MTDSLDRRIDTASIVIKASPQTIYRAFLDPEAYVLWIPPQGMKGHIYEFDAREGGAYRMALIYKMSEEQAAIGKTTANADVVQGKFLKLVPDEQIVQLIVFESEDPAYSGDMTMTWNLTAVPEGTRVTVVCENVPAGVDQNDHIAGLNSTLENLAAFTEQ